MRLIFQADCENCGKTYDIKVDFSTLSKKQMVKWFFSFRKELLRDVFNCDCHKEEDTNFDEFIEDLTNEFIEKFGCCEVEKGKDKKEPETIENFFKEQCDRLKKGVEGTMPTKVIADGVEYTIEEYKDELDWRTLESPRTRQLFENYLYQVTYPEYKPKNNLLNGMSKKEIEANAHKIAKVVSGELFFRCTNTKQEYKIVLKDGNINIYLMKLVK